MKKPRTTFLSCVSLVLATVLAAGVGIEAPCRADLIIQAPTITALPGSGGSFDVLITSTGGTYDVAADTIELSLTGLTGVAFTGVLPQANPPNSYIYVDSATNVGGTFTFDSFPNTQFDAFDSEFARIGYRAINPGDVFGLVNVSYSVSSTAPAGTGMLVIGPDTSLSDTSGNNIAFTAQNGSFTVGTASSIPEPASFILAAIGFAGLVGLRARARSRSVAVGRNQARNPKS